MSEANEDVGRSFYETAKPADRAWMERQWSAWPSRVHPQRTTNISFHYGGVQAYRAEHDEEPHMSSDFRSHVEMLDRYAAAPARKGE